MSTSTLERALDRIRQGPAGPAVGAFFDYDGTLIDGYSVLAYYGERLRKRELGLDEMADLARQSLKRRLSDAEFDELIRAGVLDWAGRPEAEIEALWARLFRERIADNQFPEAWQLVQAHKRMGHTVAIASSATRYQIAPLAQEWEIEHVLCTEVVVRKNHLTGAVLGRPAWGQGKADAVAAFARRTGVRLRQSYAYANGDEDIAFLRQVGKPSAVNPKPELARAAQQAQWPVLEFAQRRIPSLKSIARSTWTYGAMAGSFAAGLTYAAAGGDKRRAVDLTVSLGSDLALAAAGIDIEVQGEENLWAQRPAIFIFNHQSKLDLLLVAKLVRRGLTGVAKKEAAKVPGIGAFMRMAEVAFVDRGNPQAGSTALEPVVDMLRKGLSVAMAPEGTRSLSPRLGPFKKGAFHLAMQAGVPLVPVVIRNAGACMARGDQVLRAGTVQVAVLPPVSVQGWRVETLDRHVAAVRRLFLDTLADWPDGQAHGQGRAPSRRQSAVPPPRRSSAQPTAKPRAQPKATTKATTKATKKAAAKASASAKARTKSRGQS